MIDAGLSTGGPLHLGLPDGSVLMAEVLGVGRERDLEQHLWLVVV
jgi:hypothetical protein